jgi:Arc/MetJ-type ribon-helix-helix transcriptional regulator
MPPKGTDTSFHLLRVRIKKQYFFDLQAAAQEETHATGTYTTVSDLVRSAIIDWLQINASARRISPQLVANIKQIFVPSNVAIPALDASAGVYEDEQLRVEAESLEAETVLDALDKSLAELAASVAAQDDADLED